VLVIMTDSTPLNGNDAVLAAEYALGVLQGTQRETFARRMAENPALAAEVRKWDEEFISFAEDISPVTPPETIQVALEKRLFADSTSSARPSFWNSLGFWRGLSIASLAAIIAMGAWNLQKPVEEAAPALVAQVAGDSKAVQLVAYYDEAKGELRLNRTLGTAADGRSFELWLIAGQDAPVSLGLLPLAATTRITVPQALRAKFTGGVLAISDEPTGGSTTGAPTGAVLATGQLTAI
jgi:anti-sigma-K factor RskA